jgi:hypothetical protein
MPYRDSLTRIMTCIHVLDMYCIYNRHAIVTMDLGNIAMDLGKGTLTWQTPVYSKKVSLTKKIGKAGHYRRK